LAGSTQRSSFHYRAGGSSARTPRCTASRSIAEADSIEIKLFVGPGSEEIRQKLFDMARAHPDVFETPHSLQAGGSPFYQIFSRQLLEQRMYEDATDLELETELRGRWAEFLREDLSRIDAVLKQEEWIWEPVETAGPA
jgi:hypothetical protein